MNTTVLLFYSPKPRELSVNADISKMVYCILHMLIRLERPANL